MTVTARRGLRLLCRRRRIRWLHSWFSGGANGADGSRNEFVVVWGDLLIDPHGFPCSVSSYWCREWSGRSRRPGREDGAVGLRWLPSSTQSCQPSLALVGKE